MEQIAVHVRQEPGRFSTQDQHIAAEKRSGVERGAVYLLSRVRLIGEHAARWAENMLNKSMSDAFTVDGLARRGVHFAVCGVATRGLASQIAGPKASRETIEDIMDELVAALPVNGHLMASGILAAQRAGEYGYTVRRGSIGRVISDLDWDLNCRWGFVIQRY